MKAIFVGRFQPFHLGHLHAIQKCIDTFGSVTVVIGSIQESNTDRNPFTFEQRKAVIEKVFGDKVKVFGIEDYNNDELWINAVIAQTGSVDVVITGNDWTQRCFEKIGVQVRDTFWLEPEKYNGTKIRAMKEWKGLVPKEMLEVKQ